MRISCFAGFCLFFFKVCAQSLTTTDTAGNTIIEQVVTVTPAVGPVEISTEIITTILAATSTTPNAQQGPVGQPPPTTVFSAGGPTPYTYITTNAAGAYTTVVATFIPTFPSTVIPPPVTTGTVLSYSDWLSIIGTNTAQPAKGSADRRLPSFSLAWLGLLIGGALGGVFIVLL